MRSTAGGKPRPWRVDQLEIGAQLRRTVEQTAVATFADAGEREAALRNDALQGGVRRRLPIVKPRGGESRHGYPSRGRDDGHQWELGLVRPNTDEAAARSQALPRSPEGMDHAPDRDSSQRPAEDGDVEGGAASGQLLDGANAKRDIWDAKRGLLIQRILDAESIRVDG